MPLSRLAEFRSPFGHLANFAATATTPADVVRDPMTGVPTLDANGSVQAFGAPDFYRILEYVQVPSRFVGTDTMLNAETFNDVPVSTTYPTEPIGTDISSPADPRYNFQPPFNKVSRERDPGRVNLNTVTGRRIPPTATAARADLVGSVRWDHASIAMTPILRRRSLVISDLPGETSCSAVAATPQVNAVTAYDRLISSVLAARCVRIRSQSTISRRCSPIRSVRRTRAILFRCAQMVQYGVDASLLRSHPFDRGPTDNVGATRRRRWRAGFGDARDAGFGAER